MLTQNQKDMNTESSSGNPKEAWQDLLEKAKRSVESTEMSARSQEEYGRSGPPSVLPPGLERTDKKADRQRVPWRRMEDQIVESTGYTPLSQRIAGYEMVRGGFSSKYRRHLDSREEFMRGILNQKPQASRYMIPVQL